VARWSIGSVGRVADTSTSGCAVEHPASQDDRQAPESRSDLRISGTRLGRGAIPAATASAASTLTARRAGRKEVQRGVASRDPVRAADRAVGVMSSRNAAVQLGELRVECCGASSSRDRHGAPIVAAASLRRISSWERYPGRAARRAPLTRCSSSRPPYLRGPLIESDVGQGVSEPRLSSSEDFHPSGLLCEDPRAHRGAPAAHPPCVRALMAACVDTSPATVNHTRGTAISTDASTRRGLSRRWLRRAKRHLRERPAHSTRTAAAYHDTMTDRPERSRTR